jgi:hypothetical protein
MNGCSVRGFTKTVVGYGYIVFMSHIDFVHEGIFQP